MSFRRRLLAWAGAAGLLAAPWARAFPADRTTRDSGRRPNVLIISLDCLRADHLGSNGYRRNTSPNIDRLARSGIRFSMAIAQASYSLASTVSLFTGQQVPTHGVPGREGPRLPPAAITWAEVLRTHGYRTAAFTGSVHNSSMQGLEQGFEVFHNEMEYGRLAEVLPRARRWLDRREGGPFFLFLHAYDAHAPYDMPEAFRRLFERRYTGILNRFGLGHGLGMRIAGRSLQTEDGQTYQLSPRDMSHWIAQYDGSIANADRQIGDFLAYLGRTGLAENTIVILLGNHGEAFWERGQVMRRRHGDIYGEGIHVPLIIRLPKQLSRGELLAPRAPSVIDQPVQLIDLMPTVLDWLGIPIPAQVEGKSLASLIAGRTREDFNHFVFSVGAGGADFPWRSCVLSGGWKLIHFRDRAGSLQRKELYHLAVDPGERQDLRTSRPELARSLGMELSRFDAALTPGWGARIGDALIRIKRVLKALRWGRWPFSASRARKAYRPNILMIIMESGRPDHFSVLGYRRNTTPNIDDLARRSAVLRAAQSQSNWTLPSFASILTGKYPRALGMFDASRRLSDFPFTDPPLRRGESTLPKVLRRAGYRTAGFFTGHFNAAEYGFDQGFDVYRNYQRGIDKDRKPMRSFADFLPEAFRWMEHKDDSPFFVLMNPSETHRPYLAPAPYLRSFVKDYAGRLDPLWLSKDVFSGLRKDEKGWSLGTTRLSQRDIDYLVARYDASLAYSDSFIGQIMERMRRSQLLYDTIIVLLADHGELLGEHGAFLHCTQPPRLYQELTHVPLIIKTPKLWLDTAGRSVAQPVGLVDLMPTLLDLVRIPRDLRGRTQGRSFLGLILPEQEPWDDRPLFAETSGHGLLVQSIRDGDWDLILTQPASGGGRTAELYRLSSDPGEKRDLARENPAVVERLLGRLSAWTDDNERLARP
ncbi:MAG: sulfatase [Elusimicrobia bacterium]|nr:sulfatase [Elusimicrobiota bacterium]